MNRDNGYAGSAAYAGVIAAAFVIPIIAFLWIYGGDGTKKGGVPPERVLEGLHSLPRH